MVPGSVWAALALIALIPGYAYLRLSEGSRRPRSYTALEEVLEVAAVGLGTTGLATGIFVIGWPEELFATTSQALDGDPRAARNAILIAAAIAGLALGIAFLGAWLTNSLGNGTYAPSVWHSTLGRHRKDHLRHIMIELSDGKTIDGPLHAYTTLDGEHPRDIALKSPLTITDGSRSWNPGFDFVTISSDQIANIWMVFNPDEGQPARRRGRRRRSAAPDASS